MKYSYTLNQLVEQPLSKANPTHTLDLNFGICSFNVYSNSRDLIQVLESYYHPFTHSKEYLNYHIPQLPVNKLKIFAIQFEPMDFGLEYTLKNPEPRKTRIKEEFAQLADGRIVRKRLTGMIFLFGKNQHYAFGPTTENPNQIINFINNRLMQLLLDHGFVLLHAAGVEHNGKGIALCGFAGMGKSTLALQFMNHHWNFISNDRVLIRKTQTHELQMVGIPKLPRINPGTILNNPKLIPILTHTERVRYEALSNKELWDLEAKYDAPLHQIYGANCIRFGAPMEALIILNWERTSTESLSIQEVNIANRPDLFPAFSKQPGLFYESELDPQVPHFQPEHYISTLDHTSIKEITGQATFETAVHALISELN